VKRFDLPQLAEAPLGSIAYSSNRQTFVRMAPSPLSIGIRRNFSRGATSIFCLYFSGCWRCKCKRTFTKRFTHSMLNEIAPFYGNSHKKFTSLAAIARCIATSWKIHYLEIFQAGYLVSKKQIAVVYNKTTIMS